MPHESPIPLLCCRLCGHDAELHHARSGKWYIKCKFRKCGIKTEESSSKLSICKVWNVRNKNV